MKKIGFILIGLVALAVAAVFLINRPSKPPKTYSFLEGATLVESVKKDPRYGGGQRDVYEISGDLDEVLERVRKEVAPSSTTKEVNPGTVSYYKDKETTIAVGAGRAIPWKNYAAKHIAIANDQEMKEIMQKGAAFMAKPGIVSIVIDRPFAETASKTLTAISRKVSPPEPRPDTRVTINLVRSGSVYEAEVTFTNSGTDTQDEFSLTAFRIGGSTPKGLPLKVVNLKAGASHVEILKLPGMAVKGSSVPYQIETTSTYKGKSLPMMSGGATPVP